MIQSHSAHLKQILSLNYPLDCLRGIGPKRAHFLAQRGLYSVLDLLFFMPSRYEDRTRIIPIQKAANDTLVLVRGVVAFSKEEKFYRSGKQLFKIIIGDETGSVELVWFQYKKPHLKRFSTPGQDLLVYGRMRLREGKRQMVHPDVSLGSEAKEKGEGLGFYPVYPSIRGVSGQLLRSTVRDTLNRFENALTDFIPTTITHGHGLPRFDQAIRGVHIPPPSTSLNQLNQFRTAYHRRIRFDHFFLVMLSLAYRNKMRHGEGIPAMAVPKGFIGKLAKRLPFQLTVGQASAIREIVKDLGCGKPMNRLLQGDVGCGKTVVAAVAAYVVTLNHYQTAFMVPTQVLAHQHYEYFLDLAKTMGFRPVLLTGTMKKSERIAAYRKIGRADYNVVIGTQALIQDAVCFGKLGMVIIDEQHRFGVRQRALLDRKGENPHLLVMTATPIPRTLAMTVYADLNISTIKEYPRGHRPVETYLVNEEQKRIVYNVLRQRMDRGEQALVICPWIEGSEDADIKNVLEMSQKLKKIYGPPVKVGLIHGGMSSEQQGNVTTEFRQGRIHLLVATTVIEVGLHIPKATVMVIERPERFGLAQLHQLRGRVGRGGQPGLCFLMAKSGLSKAQRAKLEILTRSQDGFEIAERDLEMRGQGELTGMKQTGMGELDFAEMLREPELLMVAKKEAENLLGRDPELTLPENQHLRLIVQSTGPKPIDF